MELDRALAALGLSGPAPRAAIRRAYLKAVRQHPPERDPEGFRRIRDAFELLDSAPWMWREPVQETAHAPEPVVPETTAPEVAAPEPVVPGPTAPEVAAPRTVDEPREPPNWHALAREVQRGSLDQASRALLEFLDDAERERDELPPPSLVLAVIVRLIVQHRGKLARRVRAAFEAALEQGRYPLREMDAGIAAQWLLIRELQALGHDIPRALRRTLAHGIAHGDYEPAAAELKIAIRRSNGAILGALKKHAPTLRDTVMPLFDPEPGPEQRRGLFNQGVPWWHWVWISVVLIRCITLEPFTHKTTPPEAPAAVALPSQNAAQGAPALAAPSTTPLTLEQAIDQAVAAGDCAGAGDLWPSYARIRAVLRTDDASKQAFSKRKDEVRRICPELSASIQEGP